MDQEDGSFLFLGAEKFVDHTHHLSHKHKLFCRRRIQTSWYLDAQDHFFTIFHIFAFQICTNLVFYNFLFRQTVACYS